MSEMYYEDDDFIHVFTDGSANKHKSKLGLGWVTVTKDSLIPSVKSLGISYQKGSYGVHRALIAEIMAATFALQDIPSGSKVKLHTDHTEVARIINNHEQWLTNMNNKILDDPRIQVLADILWVTSQKHSYIEVEVTNDRVDDPLHKKFMIQAHNAAIGMSGSKNFKFQPQSNEEALEEGGETPIQWPPKLG